MLTTITVIITLTTSVAKATAHDPKVYLLVIQFKLVTGIKRIFKRGSLELAGLLPLLRLVRLSGLMLEF